MMLASAEAGDTLWPDFDDAALDAGAVQPGRSVRIQRRLGTSGATEILGDVPLSLDGRSFSLSANAAAGSVDVAALARALRTELATALSD